MNRRLSTPRLSGPRDLLPLVLIILIWDVGVRVFAPASFILPSPANVGITLWHDWTFLIGHAWLTLVEMLIGLVVGSLAGIVTALTMAHSAMARRLLLPVIVATQTLPVFAIAPLLVIWFGFGMGSKVVMAAMIIYFPIASAFFDGLTTVDRHWLDLGRSWGANPLQVLFRIRVPAALPSLASGLKIAATLAPIGAVVGEWAGASAGLGYVMLQANARMQTDVVFAALIVLAIMAFLLRKVVSLAADRLIYWQNQTL